MTVRGGELGEVNGEVDLIGQVDGGVRVRVRVRVRDTESSLYLVGEVDGGVEYVCMYVCMCVCVA